MAHLLPKTVRVSEIAICELIDTQLIVARLYQETLLVLKETVDLKIHE